MLARIKLTVRFSRHARNGFTALDRSRYSERLSASGEMLRGLAAVRWPDAV